MPIARTYDISQVLDACAFYFQETGRRVTFEYSLVEGVNDAPEQALELAHLLAGMHGHCQSDSGKPHQRAQLRGFQAGVGASFSKYS